MILGKIDFPQSQIPYQQESFSKRIKLPCRLFNFSATLLFDTIGIGSDPVPRLSAYDL